MAFFLLIMNQIVFAASVALMVIFPSIDELAYSALLYMNTNLGVAGLYYGANVVQKKWTKDVYNGGEREPEAEPVPDQSGD